MKMTLTAVITGQQLGEDDPDLTTSQIHFLAIAQGRGG
jgi:hypothetical protein